MLEREARASAIVAEQNKTPINSAKTTNELENELLDVEDATTARENSSTS